MQIHVRRRAARRLSDGHGAPRGVAWAARRRAVPRRSISHRHFHRPALRHCHATRAARAEARALPCSLSFGNSVSRCARSGGAPSSVRPGATKRGAYIAACSLFTTKRVYVRVLGALDCALFWHKNLFLKDLLGQVHAENKHVRTTKKSVMIPFGVQYYGASSSWIHLKSEVFLNLKLPQCHIYWGIFVLRNYCFPRERSGTLGKVMPPIGMTPVSCRFLA